MIGHTIQYNDIETFKLSNSLLKNPLKFNLGASFEEVLESKAEEVKKETQEKTQEIVEEGIAKKKKSKDNANDKLPDITQITQNNNQKSSREIQNTYKLLDKFRDNKRSQEELLLKSPRQLALNNAHNFAGQALIQPVFDQPQRRMNRSQMLDMWEKFAPTLTEDPMKKAVRLDIPLLNDIQALVLRIHPDKSISASLLGSKIMGELIKNNKDQLDRNLRHHHLSLREFNTYRSELEFTNESGTKKKKKQAKQNKTKDLDLV